MGSADAPDHVVILGRSLLPFVTRCLIASAYGAISMLLMACMAFLASCHTHAAESETFINALGFTKFDSDCSWPGNWNGARRFLHYDRERWTRHADNEIWDAEKAILAFDGPRTHVRYKLALQDDTANGIVRYSLFLVDDETSDRVIRREAGGVPPSWGQIGTARMAGDRVWGMPYGFDPGPVEWTEVQTEGLDAWRVTLEFSDGAGAPIRYRSVLNGEVATYISDHWMYFSLAQFPGFVYARDPVSGISLPLLERFVEPQRHAEMARLPSRLIATGRTISFAGREAVEFSFVFSQPDNASSSYIAWTGTFWAVRGLPAASGWYGLPGSPFAGRSAGFGGLWQALGWDISDHGLIVRADITLHDGLLESDLRPLIAGSSDAATLSGKGWGRETLAMRVTELAPEGSRALSRTFPDLVAIGRNAWNYELPPQTVGILERY